MINIQDLHFKSEILPLFDFVHNEFSKGLLIQLLSEMPESVEEIYLRQDILKSLLANDQLYIPFSYSRIEFKQVYTYIEDKKSKGAGLRGNLLKIHLLFAHAERSRETGELSQLFIFLDKINHFYFSSLNPQSFPDAFRDKLINIRRMMTDLQVGKYCAIARRKGFTIPEITGLILRLEEKIRSGEMDGFWKDFFLFEAWFSVSKGIKENHFTFPEFRERDLTITEFYHPLLKTPIKNSLTLRENVTLITGPNMSGKSTLLKSIGLCVYLAHLGLAVPAQQCALPFFDVISVAINLNDDITNGYSHFMAEIKTVKKVVAAAHDKKRCFAIFDELFRGTNIEDALAISKTTILGLTAFQDCYFFISTHLHQLEQAIDLNAHKIRTVYIECTLDKGIPVFTYRLKPGWSELKIGQILFEQEGLNALLSAPGII
jgi:DNA mismatch repair protein MutS